MIIRRKLIIIAVSTSALISGCCLLPPGDKPLIAGDSLPQEIAEPAATIEAGPSATTAPPTTTPTKKRSVTPPAEGSVKPRMSYTVSEGEMLWAIAKRADVYGDPFLWPLLYQANRDQIKDPRTIYAGQNLTIPRNATDEEREKARNLAKKSAIFSPE
jgi:Tfp pilus assembly protein FimV